MATVSSLVTELGNSLNDANEQTFTSALKITALNNAQSELVLRVLGFTGKFQGIYDLLSDVVEEEIMNIGTSGFNLNSLANRNVLRNGYINSRLNISGKDKFPVRYTIDRLGITENSFMAGSDEDPVCRIVSNKYFLDIDVGSYPQNVTIWYIGEPYTMAASAAGSGKTQSVATSDLNVVFHDLMVLIAKTELLLGRGTPRDIQEANVSNQRATSQILSLVKGQAGEPKTASIGQYIRKAEESQEKQEEADAIQGS